MLSYQLTKKPLPGLTSIEQLELLALADTFASAKLDLEESPGSIERGVKFAKKDGNDSIFFYFFAEASTSTVNDVIDALFQIDGSCQMNTPLTMLPLYYTLP